jgi:hypothetical protein
MAIANVEASCVYNTTQTYQTTISDLKTYMIEKTSVPIQIQKAATGWGKLTGRQNDIKGQEQEF